ncbi:uncharacterized protein BKCO1_7000123 [Diplodia corticola]|uniref:Uncharacterized protein n=1 Tax=Diplodia corticola TaxID=236234 RepID=A0A1J9SAE0_9PEZI|nr:uncharacterized protein BKCO1_7000123 [Diplodia corticola]OJD37447.1 hypothetical protein BKCO1_7000123 [Diplodia corticola]
MPRISPSIPNPDFPSYHDPEMYSAVRPQAFDTVHDLPKRYDVDDKMALPRWAVFLMVFIPLSIFFLGVTIYYLNRNRRSGMARMVTPVELEDIQLQDLESRGQRSPTPAPYLPELYWPGVFHPSPKSEVTVFPRAGSQPAPQQPRTRLDKDLPDLPRHAFVEDAEDWETVAPVTRENTFNDAFAQHEIDQERRDKEQRDKERRDKECRDRDRREENERSLLEALERRRQRDRNQRRGNPYQLSPLSSDDSNNSGSNNKKSPPLHDMNPHVNEGYARYRRYRLQSSDVDNDTDVILASDTNTMGPPTTATGSNTGGSSHNPFAGGSGGGAMLSGRDRRRQELTAAYEGDADGFPSHPGRLRPPQRAYLAGGHNFVAPAVSGPQFPSDQSEMDNFTEAMITDDPFVPGGRMGARQKK